MAGLRETTAAEQQEGAGYLVGDEVCALFAGALTFREQCVAAGILYKDLDSEGDGTTDDGGGKMMLEDEAEEDGHDVCAHVCSHNDRCEVCDDGHETNKRECFHAHGTWHGGMTPQMVSDVAGVPALAEAAARAVGSQLCGELPFEYHTIATAVRALRIGMPRVAAHCVAAPPDDGADDDDVRQWYENTCKPFAYVVAMAKHLHRHCGSCLKGTSGNKGCRFGCPFPHLSASSTTPAQVPAVPGDGHQYSASPTPR